MAKAPASKTSAKTPAPAATPAPSKPFDFMIEEGLEIPTNVGRAASAVELPFKGKFDQMTKHGQSFFIPNSFWTAPKEEGGRAVDPEKADSGYIRSKVRGNFNTWKKADDARSDRDILMVPRKAGDNAGGDKTFPEDGFTVFMIITKE